MLNRYKFPEYGRPLFHIDYVITLFKILGSELTTFYYGEDYGCDGMLRFEFAKDNANDLTLEVIRSFFQCSIYVENGRYVFIIKEGRLAERVVFLEIKKALKAVGLTETLFYRG